MEPNNVPPYEPAEAISESQSEEILQKFDSESRFRNRLIPVYDRIWKVIAIAMSLFHLYIAGFGTMPATQQRIMHLMFAMTLVFLLYPAGKNRRGAGFLFLTLHVRWPRLLQICISISMLMRLHCGTVKLKRLRLFSAS